MGENLPCQKHFLNWLRENPEEYAALRNRTTPLSKRSRVVVSRIHCPLCGCRRAGITQNTCRDCGAQMRSFD